VHDIIFPRGGNSESTPLDEHNLWIIDERLNFASYLSSDNPLGGGSQLEPDLLIFNNRVLFRGKDIESNPFTIIEFKRPGRKDLIKDDFRDNPVDQVINYVRDIRKGKCKTPEGRPIRVTQDTPAYGYVICDLTPSFEEWLLEARSFTPMPDQLGWFNWENGIKLYIEVLSWEKVLQDAEIRNSMFFERLGI